jgi:5-methylcytosine-specific restriction endonuclease McrA
VACCKDCNSEKANRTPEQAGMRLLKKPVAPSIHDPKFTFRLQIKNPRPEWGSYLYWNVELEK